MNESDMATSHMVAFGSLPMKPYPEPLSNNPPICSWVEGQVVLTRGTGPRKEDERVLKLKAVPSTGTGGEVHLPGSAQDEKAVQQSVCGELRAACVYTGSACHPFN
jgi:hypothetical protein